jgi:tRNA(Arg) A34 adenosine deaminase TadA
MQHPGLISPTSMERVMQVAYTVKLNSGCISRQVGAVVTDSDNSIKSVGWNDVAQGQVPCAMRSIDGLINDFHSETYSHYERNNEKFREKAREFYDIFKPVIQQSSSLKEEIFHIVLKIYITV